MKPLTLCLALTLLSAAPLLSDESSKAPKMCSINGLVYSPGAIAKKGERTVRCGTNGKWRRATNGDLGMR